jgi:homogentisate 1,2-dioxygenase
MKVGPHEICVIQRGIKFKIDVDPNVETVDVSKDNHPKARGYICEVYESSF